MDLESIWTAIERLSAWFYEPLVFWAVPFALAAVWEALGKRRRERGGSAH